MPRVFSEEQNPQTILKHCGIAIRKVGHFSRHVGILYKKENEWNLLHLARHLELCDDAMPMEDARHLWVNPEPAIDEIRLESLAAYCRLISDRHLNGGLPYGFSRPVNWFSVNGDLAIQLTNGMGLTCSSFVLAVFSGASLPLIDEQTWSLRDDDKKWQEMVITLIEQSEKATAEHIQRMRENVPAIRYRPEEVAGAATCDLIPAAFASCAEMASQILRALDQV